MRHFYTAALVGVSILGLSAPALAQNQPDLTDGEDIQPESTVEQDVVPGGEPEQAYQADRTAVIVVEARRRDESVQDVPLVVNTVTTEAITQLNLRDFKDIQTVVPGLNMASNANGIGTTSSVRGVAFDVNASGAFGTIEYYLNDTPITSGAVFNAMYDIGQIEVLRGPQGTLRGRASPSGSITISHRKPDLDEVGGYVYGTVNDIGGANVNAAVGMPIIPGILAVRVAGLVERGRANRVKSINSDIDPYTRNKSGRIFLRAEPTSWLNAEAVYQRVEQESRTFEQVACFDEFADRAGGTTSALPCTVRIDPEDRLAIRRTPSQSEQTFDIFTWRASAGFAGQRLFYNGAHTKQEIRAYANFAASGSDDAGVLPFNYPGTVTFNDTSYDSMEVRLQNEDRLFGMFDYVVGYFNLKQDSPSYLFTGRATSLTTAAFSPTLRTANIEEESFFGNLTVHIGDRTELSGGARRIKIDSDSRLFTIIGVNPPLTLGTIPRGPSNLEDRFGIAEIDQLPVAANPCEGVRPCAAELNFGAANPQTFKKTIFSASAKHRFSDDLMVYANFGTSFRPGNNVVRLPANARTSPTEAGFLFLPAETSKSYEVGFKSEFMDDTLTLNVAAFRQDFKNYGYRASSGVPVIVFPAGTAPFDPTSGVPYTQGASVGQANFVAPVPVRIYGVEAEVNWNPSERFNMSLNGAYARGKIRNGNVPCLDLNGDGVPDASRPATLTPEDLFAVAGTENVSVCQVSFRSSLASPWSGNFQAEYNMPVFNDASEAFVRTLVSYNGSSRVDEQNPFDDYGDYALVNLYAGLRDADGAWEVTLYGKNIFEEQTVLSTSLGALFTSVPGVPGGAITSPYIGLGNASSPSLTAPREFGVTARFAFGSR